MKIAVCVKQVVTREWQVRVDAAGTWVRGTGRRGSAMRGSTSAMYGKPGMKPTT